MRHFAASLVSATILFLHCQAHAGTLVQFRTTFGDIEVELYDQDKPVTVSNFLAYVRSGRFQNQIAHRLVPGFVIQGGGFTLATNTISPVPTFPPIRNEFATGRTLSNVFGTIAMAKLGGDTNSATSQWFLNLANNTFLDAADTNNLFVVFGHVIAGTNVLAQFNTFQNYTGSQTSNLVVNLSGSFGAAFAACPLLLPSLASSNFVFVDVSLLSVVIVPAGSARQISWNSATGLTNVVEFTTNFPPAWKTLVVTNGNGARFTVTDATNAPSRFYRVRVY
jgi:cyclophilin family peptidyl-prolyl cis-trans isomerase